MRAPWRFALLTPLLLAGRGMAGWELGLGAVSDYVWRGVSQTDGTPAIQGGLSWSLPAGLYLGGWTSRVDYGDAGRLEADLFAGWAGEGDELGWELCLQRYHYPGGDGDAAYAEAILSLSRGPLELELAGTPDYGGGGEAAGYAVLSLARPLAGAVSLQAGLGCAAFTRSAADALYGPGEPAWMLDWRLGLGGVLAGFDLSLAWHDTDARLERLSGGLAGSRVVLELGRTFASRE